jgi:hypothetical protein
MKIALWVIAVMLVLNFAHRVLIARPALAVDDGKGIGRYQISSWSAFTGGITFHSGYYIVDTVTGKVVETHMDAHRREINKELQSE